jgi:hypothetical protein
VDYSWPENDCISESVLGDEPEPAIDKPDVEVVVI